MAGTVLLLISFSMAVIAGLAVIVIENFKTQWLELYDRFLELLHQRDPIILMGVAMIIFFPLCAIKSIITYNCTIQNAILLVGVSGSGKTVLYNQLRDGSSHQGTQTSMKPNEDTFVLHSETTKKGKIKPVPIVDIPGHSSLLPKMHEYLNSASGVVFVVDAFEFFRTRRQVAEYLYKVLTNPSIVWMEVPILILCNKTDKVSAHSDDFICKQLEKEIENLRTTCAADPTIEYIGVPGQAFKFQQCVNQVTVARASALTGEISQAELFIREHVKP